MNVITPVSAGPIYIETYLSLRISIGRLFPGTLLHRDHDDIGHRLFTEIESVKTGARFLLFSYVEGETIDDWTYILIDGASNLKNLAILLVEIGVDINQVMSATDHAGHKIVDMAALRHLHTTELLKVRPLESSNPVPHVADESLRREGIRERSFAKFLLGSSILMNVVGVLPVLGMASPLFIAAYGAFSGPKIEEDDESDPRPHTIKHHN